MLEESRARREEERQRAEEEDKARAEAARLEAEVLASKKAEEAKGNGSEESDKPALCVLYSVGGSLDMLNE